MFFKRANSVLKQLFNFRNASVSHCLRNSLLTIIWNNLRLSNYKRIKRNLEFRKNAHIKETSLYNVQQNIFPFIYLFNLYKNHNYMAAPQSDPGTLSAFEASKRLTMIKFTK